MSPTTRLHRTSLPPSVGRGALTPPPPRTRKTPCHCEPARTPVWQSVLPRTAPHKGNGLPRRCAPRNDNFMDMHCTFISSVGRHPCVPPPDHAPHPQRRGTRHIAVFVGGGDCPPSCQPIPVHCRGRQSGHFLEIGSLPPPPAALRRFPRRSACTAPPCPASVGRGDYTPPPPPTAPSKTRVIANQCAHWCGNPYSPARHHIRGTDCHVAPFLAMTFL